MANAVDTNEGIGEDDELIKWINDNNLKKAKDKLLDYEISLQELAQLSNQSVQQLQQFGQSELDLNLIMALRFANAVKSLGTASKYQISAPQQPMKEFVHIVMCKEEGDAIDNMNKAEKQINERIKRNIDKIDTLKQASTANKHYINKCRKEMKAKLDERMDELIRKSEAEINKKQNALSQHVQKLNEQNTAINKAQSEADNILKDTTINTGKRKTKIVKISEDVLMPNIKEPNVTPKVTVIINTDQTATFIAKIGKITSFTYPEEPIISIDKIEGITAKVIFDNIKSSYQCKVELAQNYSLNNDDGDDEKKMDWEKQGGSITNGNTYTISNLKGDTNYGIRTQYTNNYGQGPYSKIVLFKTKKVEMIKSQILSLKEQTKLLEMVNNHTNNVYNQQWELLYRGSRDGYTVDGFFAKCNGKNNTICVIQTDKNNVIGGFISIRWDKSKQTTRSGFEQNDPNAFLYLIRSSQGSQSQLFPIQNNGKGAIFYAINYFLVFGDRSNGAIIYLHNNCNSQDGSGGITGKSKPYNVSGKDLHGSTVMFKVTEVEVFQLRKS